MTAVGIEIGWRPVPRRGLFRSRVKDIDLDASVVLFADRQPVDVVFFRHLVSDDGSVRHTGDSIVGDTEKILVDIPRVPLHIDCLVVTLNSFTGESFRNVQTVSCRLIDEPTGNGIATCSFTGGHDSTARILVKLHRTTPEGWSMTTLDAMANGRTFQDLMPAILPCL
ncbi:TerD family protein [Streptomyces sp. NPDC048420]|uniref:TerD family protein n=1 Tax=Streptomyces sp. NPDC048420 TaxID=3155755 RepID=UPI00343BE690